MLHSCMKSAWKVIIVLLILLVTFGLPVLLQHVIEPEPVSRSQMTPTVTDIEQDIRFLSVPPILVPPEATFLYKVLAESLSNNAISIEILSKPEWMTWDAESRQLSGTVPKIGGIFSVSLRATSTSGDVAEQNFTVTIDAQGEVKGTKSIGLWKDPFHPNFVDQEQQVLLPGNFENETPTPQGLVQPPAVLGEKTDAQATNFVSKQVEQYILIGLVAVLIVVIGSIVRRLITLSRSNRSKLPPGVVIERGRQ